MSQQEQDLLMGGARTSAKFPTVGTLVKGIVLSRKNEQEREFGTGEPLTYPKTGDPKMMTVIALQTDERDATIDFDDGIRHLFASTGSKMQQAIREAVRKAGATTLKPGDELAIKYTGDGESPGRGLNAPKLYKAQIRVGVQPMATEPDDLMADSNAGHDPDEDPF